MPEFKLCGSHRLFDFQDDCTRAWWIALIPLAVVVFNISRLLIQRLPSRYRPWQSTFSNFLPLDEAVLLQNDKTPELVDEQDHDAHEHETSQWKKGVLVVPAAFEAGFWIFWTCRQLLLLLKHQNNSTIGVYEVVTPALLALSWLYATIRPLSIRQRTLTVPYDLFTIYLAMVVDLGLYFGTILYKQYIDGPGSPQTSHTAALILMLHVVVIGILIGTVLSLPMGIPPPGVDKEQIGKTVSPEDYTPFWGWVTFLWVYPIVQRGTGRTMNEEDVWELSPSFASKPLFLKYSTFLKPSERTKKRISLIKRLWKANSLDIILDFFMTLTSVVFNYLSPFFLKRILEAVSQPSSSSSSSGSASTWTTFLSNIASPREIRAQAYVYAILAFLVSIINAQSDVQHLWYGRRASTRIRSELMAAIFEKSLKRKDLSGNINKEDQAKEKDDGKGKSKPNAPDFKKKESLKAGADIGKIVNLMSTDAGRISNMASALTMLYGAPLELIIGSIFLYQLLGWSGFAGYVVLIVGAPLNNYLMRRGRDIMKATLEARDKRMKVLNELVSEAKFIKFGAGEDQWIDKCLGARGKELRMLIKSQINSVAFSLVWAVAPVLVSVISFSIYVYTGHRLTVPIAFTAVQIFSMIKMPMNIIPAFMAMLLTTQVAIDRINQFMDEEEVPVFVSSLLEEEESTAQHSNDGRATRQDETLGIKNGWFRWNESNDVEEKPSEKVSRWKFWKNRSSKGTMPSLPVSAPRIPSHGNAEGTATPIPRFELKDIDIIFPTGKLTVVTGPTASGKSALLLALLGEMTSIVNESTEEGRKPRIFLPKYPMQVEQETGLRNCIAYCAQSPWLEHLSIKDNILFGSPFDQERYNEVIECCALRPDLDIFEDGDATEIGARGVSLSGGQKARVALARAVYARSKHVLLDDPLSAVDSHTARHLVEKLLRGPLMANRTVVLVTHHVELVTPSAQYFVRMLDGRIDTQGTVAELQANGVLEAITHEAQADEEPAVVTAEELAIVATTSEVNGDIVDQGTMTKSKKPKKLIEDEARATGSVKWGVYNAYLKATGYFTWFLMLVILGLSQLGGVAEKLWMQIWGDAGSAPELASSSQQLISLHTNILRDSLQPEIYQSIPQTLLSNRSIYSLQPASSLVINGVPSPIGRFPSAEEHPMFYVTVFACIGLSAVAVNILGQIILAVGAYRASKRMFKDLLETVMKATMRWFDTTPTGRILNRFSKDVETIDSSLSYSLRSTLVWIAAFIVSILTIAIVFPGFLIPGLIIGYCYYKLSSGYLDAGRDLRRMESNSRSPIFASFGETLEGIVTVRAFSAERRFLDTLHSRVDQTTKFYYSFWMLNRFLLLNFQFLGAFSILITTLLVLGGWIPDWLAGLTITSAMGFTNSVYWTCRMITQLELDLNSVERVVEYLDLPQEPMAVIENHRPPAYWPSSTSNNGAMVSVNNLVIRYAPTLPPVLHGVSFDVKPKEKVGLLGRTGSGKSTLAMSLLRFVDPAEGSITIDGIDITSIGLHDLRSRLTFIPQDSVLFSGTIRENLDPFSEHTDEECLDALYRVQLISETAHASRRSTRPPSVVDAPASGSQEGSGTATPQEDKVSVNLDTDVSARGANFSAGQRQLISMARALLRQSSIIILDEATSSIDFKTDAKIQAAVREEFKNSCLLTIAHRIRTVIDYDRLLILDQGRIVEYDTPLNLIQKEGGVFRDMCLKSGTFSELESAAKEAASVHSEVSN